MMNYIDDDENARNSVQQHKCSTKQSYCISISLCTYFCTQTFSPKYPQSHIGIPRSFMLHFLSIALSYLVLSLCFFVAPCFGVFRLNLIFILTTLVTAEVQPFFVFVYSGQFQLLSFCEVYLTSQYNVDALVPLEAFQYHLLFASICEVLGRNDLCQLVQMSI